jgi:hypothetical protein
LAQGRDDIRIECAGVMAGWWFASKERRGEEPIAAGLLMLAGSVDLDESCLLKSACLSLAGQEVTGCTTYC